jgi:hypothetical protein
MFNDITGSYGFSDDAFMRHHQRKGCSMLLGNGARSEAFG